MSVQLRANKGKCIKKRRENIHLTLWMHLQLIFFSSVINWILFFWDWKNEALKKLSVRIFFSFVCTTKELENVDFLGMCLCYQRCLESNFEKYESMNHFLKIIYWPEWLKNLRDLRFEIYRSLQSQLSFKRSECTIDHYCSYKAKSSC